MNVKAPMSLSLPIHPSRVHPLTGLPLQAIGFRPNGEPLWPIMGGAPDDPPESDWTKTFGDKTPEQVKAELDAAAQKATTADSWANVFKDKTPEEVQAIARKHEQNAQANKKKADAYDGIVTTLGVAPPAGSDDDKDKDKIVDTDAVNRAVEAEKAKTKATAREVAVLRNVPDGIDGKALADSRTFMDTISALDPDADDFATKLNEAIKTATEGDAGARFRVGRDRPRPAPGQGRESEGKTGSLESGRAAYEARAEARKKGHYAGV